MKDSIYTIPISEVFEPKRGCPLCALYDALEARWVDYITGAAMMEPDVRIQTNRHGFCRRHFDMMLQQRNRLSVALMLQTRLAWADESFDAPVKSAGIFGKNTAGQEDGPCFICQKIDGEFRRIGSNIAAVWAREEDFRELYAQQEYLCYPHARMLIGAGGRTLRGEKLAGFIKATGDVSRKRLRDIKADIDAFCNLFDYRSAGLSGADEKVAQSIERAIKYLTGEQK
ncbi:MAG: DUF6062 family protein [Oscillospiraceae bacterium]|nr:DUF6062 family protein [Oscillospiraceae bacterium]